MARYVRTSSRRSVVISFLLSSILISSGLSSISFASAAPSISSISPTSGTAAGGTTVTVSGSNFDPTGTATTVRIDGVEVTPTSVTATSLTFVTPVRALASRTVGAKPIVVSTGSGSSTESVSFTYRPTLVTGIGANNSVVRLNSLASRSQAKPITRAQLSPFTVTGTDSLTSETYSYVTDSLYSSSTAAYANESHEAVGTAWTGKNSTLSASINMNASGSGRSGVINLSSSGNCTTNNTVTINGQTRSTYCSVFGPEIYSEPFYGVTGQALSFEWSAVRNSDDYEIYAFLVKVTDENSIPTPSPSNHTLLVHSMGKNQPFVSSSGNITENGTYRFRFVNGSYDATGGYALGSNMYIDPTIIVGNANVINFDPISDQIGASGTFDLNLTSTAGGAISVSSSTTSVCTVSTSFSSPNTVATITKLGTGTCILNANQGATGGFAPASRVQRAFEIRAAATAPLAPSITSIVGENGQLRVSFNPPSRDGGAVITNYKYRVGTGSWVAVNPASTSSPIIIPGLTNGTTYSITILAVNSVGDGTASTAVNGTPQASVPGAPVIGTITPGDQSLSVAFTPPGNDGGSTITNYEYSLDGGSWVTPNPTITASPLVISGLTNGTAYSVRIRAVNSSGSGSASNSVSSTPTDAVTILVTPPAPSAAPSPLPTVTPTPTPTPTPTRRPISTTPATPRPITVPSPTPSTLPTLPSEQLPTSTPSPRSIPLVIPERDPIPGVAFSQSNPIPQALVEVLLSPLAYQSPQASSPSLPSMTPAQSVVMENGEPVQVQLVVTNNENGYLLKGNNWQVALEATDTKGQPLVLDDSGNLVLNSDRLVQFQGTGFAPGSIIKVWLFSDPASIANVTADENGNFTGSAQLPGDIPVGEHTVQLNGLSKDGQVRSVALGVVVQPDLIANPTIAPVDFTPLWNLVFVTSGVVMMFLLVLVARKRWFLLAAKRRKRKEEKESLRSSRALEKKKKREATRDQLLIDEIDPILARQVAEATPTQQFPVDSRRKLGRSAPPRNSKSSPFKHNRPKQ